LFWAQHKGAEQATHQYWRIKEELLYLGEVLIFLDPRFLREYRRWVEKTCRAHSTTFRN
jgi:hypothetical protein